MNKKLVKVLATSQEIINQINNLLLLQKLEKQLEIELKRNENKNN